MTPELKLKAYLQEWKEKRAAATGFEHEMKPTIIPQNPYSPVKTDLYFVSPAIYFSKDDAQKTADFIRMSANESETLVAICEELMGALEYCLHERKRCGYDECCGRCGPIGEAMEAIKKAASRIKVP